MGIEIKDGAVRVSASYGAKVPLDGVEYASENANFSLSLEFDAEGDATAIQAAAEGLQASLAQQVKLAVFTQLGVDFTDNNGILSPKVKVSPKTIHAAPAAAPQQQRPNTGGGGGGQYGPPKADVTQQPSFVADFGDGLQQYYDLRSLKADGTFKPRAADFRPVTKGGRQVWLDDRDGNPNPQVVAALQQAGIE